MFSTTRAWRWSLLLICAGIGIVRHRRALHHAPSQIKLLFNRLWSYPYRPLAPRHIRLLKITNLPQQQQLGFELIHFPLKDPPSYAALSYTWNHAVDYTYYPATTRRPPQRHGYIQCDGFRIRVTANLMEFFSQLHRRWNSLQDNDTVYIWVDAVCINQDDFLERASQVQYMGEIYSHAAKVYAWLGSCEEGVDSVEWLHTTFYPLVVEMIDEHGFEAAEAKLRPENSSLGIFERLGVEAGITFEQIIEDYRLFCVSRNWFRRAWVSQEIALAADVEVLIGSRSFAWQTLRGFARLAMHFGWGKGPSTRYTGLIEHAGNDFDRFIHLRDVCIGTSTSEPSAGRPCGSQLEWCTTASASYCLRLFVLLVTNRSTESSDPRDKIYSALGMAGHDFDETTIHLITPDYTKIVSEVYTSTATTLLQEGPKLIYLSAVADTLDRKLQLPSWVPDFSAQNPTNPIVHIGPPDAYNATFGQTTAPTKPQISGTTLSVKALPIDIISQVCTSFATNHETRILELLDFISSTSDSPTPTMYPSPILEIIARTLTGNIQQSPQSKHYPAQTSYITCCFREYIKDALVVLCLSAQASGPDKPPSKAIATRLLNLYTKFQTAVESHVFPSLDSVLNMAAQIWNTGQREDSARGDALKQELAYFERSLNQFMAHRCLYRTCTGYIGVGPVSTEVGDVVVLLDSAVVPHVLRGCGSGSGRATNNSNSAEYKLVGETYLYGGMNGELLRLNLGDEGFGGITIV